MRYKPIVVIQALVRSAPVAVMRCELSLTIAWCAAHAALTESLARIGSLASLGTAEAYRLQRQPRWPSARAGLGKRIEDMA